MRYAVYWYPHEKDPLLAAGTRWLGRSVADASLLIERPLSGSALAKLIDCTHLARRYGFHATVKAPLRLKDDLSERQFLDAVARLAIGFVPFPMPRLSVARLGNFVALRPAENEAALRAVAEKVVTDLDTYRRPPDASDLAQRLAAVPTPHHAALLQRWGYPYVLDAYRFHMTLSDPVADQDAETLMEAATHHFAAALDHARTFDSLAVFVEPAPGASFTLLARLPFGPGR